MVDVNQAGNQEGSVQPARLDSVANPNEVSGSVAVPAIETNASGDASQLVEELLASTVPAPKKQPSQTKAAPPIVAPVQIRERLATLNGNGSPANLNQAPVIEETPRPLPEVSPQAPAAVDHPPQNGRSSPETGVIDTGTAINKPAQPTNKEAALIEQEPAGQESTGEQPEGQQPEDLQTPSQLLGNRQPIGSIPVILFDGVTKVYSAQPNKPALSNITMSIHAGEFLFLVGHSGSGKSTFIRLINREIVATRGKLAVAGEDVVRMRNWRVPYLRRNIGCVYQDFKLLPNKTAFGNVAFALEVIGKSKHIIRTQVPEVLRLVGLEDKLDKYPEQLSGGEQQRVSIARAIVNRPPLLICDEPTGNLDPQTSLGIMRLLDRINRTGTTILVATHDREMVDSLRKRVVELENGYLVRDQDKGVYGTDA